VTSSVAVVNSDTCKINVYDKIMTDKQKKEKICK